MTRTLFFRLAIAFLAVVIISTAGLGLTLAQLLERHVFDERTHTLLRHGYEVAELTAGLFAGTVDRREVVAQVRLISAVTGAQLWIVDRQGRFLELSGVSSGPLVLQNSPELEQVLSGSPLVARGEFAGRFVIPVLTVGVPVTAGDRVLGAVFIHTPVGGIRQAVAALVRLVWIAGAVGIALAVAVAYLVSSRIARPLGTMAAMAGRMAAGDFSLRVPSAGTREVSQLGRALNDLACRLDRLERTRREFIATVSHELRSPMTSIRGFVQGILDGTIGPEDRHRYLSIAFAEIERLSRLVDELLLLASLEAEVPDLERRPVDLCQLLTDSVEQLRPLAAESGVSLETDRTGRAIVLGDRDRLKQVIINLLDNAVRFSPAGQTVTVGLETTEAGAVFTVTDRGPGIDPEHLPHIWDRFYKADRARSRSAPGSGLGLAIARSLVLAHSGAIEVRSAPGRGTAFVVTLPTTTTAAGDEDPRPAG